MRADTAVVFPKTAQPNQVLYLALFTYGNQMSKLQSFLPLLFLLPFISPAQLNLQASHISLGYLAPFAVYDIGAKAGVGFSCWQWEQVSTGKEKTKARIHQIYFEPQLAYFGQRNYYHALWANLETGWKWQGKGKKRYSSLSLGLGYLNRSEALTLTTHLDGSFSVSEWENRPAFLPSLNYSWGIRVYRSFGLYTRFSYAYQVYFQHTNAGLLFFELGVRYTLLPS